MALYSRVVIPAPRPTGGPAPILAPALYPGPALSAPYRATLRSTHHPPHFSPLAARLRHRKIVTSPGLEPMYPFIVGLYPTGVVSVACPCARTVEWLTPQYFNKRFVRGVLGSNPSVVRRFFREEKKLWARRVWRRRGRGVWYRRRGVGLRPCGGGDPPLWRRVAH